MPHLKRFFFRIVLWIIVLSYKKVLNQIEPRKHVFNIGYISSQERAVLNNLTSYFKAIVTMDANSDENVFWCVHPKSSSEHKMVTLWGFSDILTVNTFLPPSKDGWTWWIYVLESPLMKLSLLNGEKQSKLTSYFLEETKRYLCCDNFFFSCPTNTCYRTQNWLIYQNPWFK
jgi:hypothetical protein